MKTVNPGTQLVAKQPELHASGVLTDWLLDERGQLWFAVTAEGGEVVRWPYHALWSRFHLVKER